MMKFLPLLPVIALAACGKPAPDQGAANTATPAAVAGAAPAAFTQCTACHTVTPGAPNGLGPNLHGVFGTKAGEVAGYSFSPAFKAWGATLDEATLDKLLTNPMATVPGTKMAFAGISDPAARKAVIEYLKTQK